jgi:hypothetical protein
MTITTADRDRMAAQMLQTIREIQEAGELPATLSGFGVLHDHFDANVGWSDEIDSLGHDDWADVQNRVDELIKASLSWTRISNGFKAETPARTYYVSNLGGEYIVGFIEPGDGAAITNIKDVDNPAPSLGHAKLIAQLHADAAATA